MLSSHCSIQQMALNSVLSAFSTVKNSILYHSSDLSSFSQEYEKLLEFVSAASEPYKTQLAYFIYPMFVHVYLELIVNGEKEMAQEFFKKHRTCFEKSDGYSRPVADLLNITSVEDMRKHPYFKLFREDKYVVELSEDCMEYFLIYLKEMNHTAILQFLNLYFSLECDGMEDGSVLETTCSNDETFLEPPFCKTDGQSFSDEHSADAIEALKDSIERINNGPPCLPSACIYNICTGPYRFSSASVSSTCALIACGFEESSICVWNISSDAVPFQISKQEYSVMQNQAKTLCGHGGPVYGMSFSPQGELLFSCSGDTTVRAWSMVHFENVAVYTGHCYPIWDIDVSPFALYFATASKDNTARLWTTDRMYPLRVFAGHSSEVDCVRFHPNCNYIATGSSDETVRLWSVQDGRMVRLFVGHRGSISSLAFSPNGQYIASAGEDQVIKIWDIGSGSLIKDLHGHTDTVSNLCFNSDGTLLASGGMDNTVRLWDASRGLTCSTSIFDNKSELCFEWKNSPELLSTFPTKSSLHHVSFGLRNLLMAVGVERTVDTVSSICSS